MSKFVAKETTKLSDDLRNVLSDHVAVLDDENYQIVITSCAVALATEIGRLRYLMEAADIDIDTFDCVFWEEVQRCYLENRKRFGISQ